MDESRRRFLKAAVAAGGLVWVAPSILSATSTTTADPSTTETTDPSTTTIESTTTTAESTTTTEPTTTTTEPTTTTTLGDKKCTEARAWAIDLTGIVGCGAAAGGQTAGQVALADFLNKVHQACIAAQPADNVCADRFCPNRERQVCVVHRPQGAENAFKDLTGENGNPPPGCPAGTTRSAFVPPKKEKDKPKPIKYNCFCECAAR